MDYVGNSIQTLFIGMYMLYIFHKQRKGAPTLVHVRWESYMKLKLS